jgi:hypothetical protein
LSGIFLALPRFALLERGLWRYSRNHQYRNELFDRAKSVNPGKANRRKKYAP